MANTILLKRRTSGAVGAPGALKSGEPAWNMSDDIVYAGFGDDGGGNATSIVPIGGRGYFAPLDSPAFTGNPTATTQTSGNNSTRIATTAFVQDAVGAAGGGDMLKSVYDSNDDGTVDAAATAPWSGITGKPATFAPSAHAHTIGDVTGLQTQLDLKAPLSAPTFTGIPAGPTAAAGTNTTQLATTAFVDAAIQSVIGASPASLDTLNELAAALGDDANYAATTTAALAGKLASANNLSDVGSAATARGNLGLASMATQAANSVAITGGTIDGITLDGGTF